MDLVAELENVRQAFARAASDHAEPGAAEPAAEPAAKLAAAAVAPAEDRLVRDLFTPASGFSAEWLNRFQDRPALDAPAVARELYVLPDFESRTRVRFRRLGLEGRLGDLEEYTVPAAEGTAATTLSVGRKMGDAKDFVRGSAGKLPFTPGGLELSADTSKAPLRLNDSGLLDVAPGLTRGMRFALAGGGADGAADGLPSALDGGAADTPGNGGDGDGDEHEDSASDGDTASVATESELETDDGTGGGSGIVTVPLKDAPAGAAGAGAANSDIDFLLPDEIAFVRSAPAAKAPPRAKTWAHVVDVKHRIDDFATLVPNPARTWPFELDTFQKEAIYHLEQGDSVFVAAHTSAGKTVVAEYAMSLAKRHMTKCIYTSPIKALSNQKYRDFSQEYDDVGILTGDVQVNPEASTLIMTTEILRSMLYRGADIIRDVEFVIFDEVHYVNDSERGVVWEEVIIMLPDHVNFILLSATVPNTLEFATWVGRTKQKDIYVISTTHRPVPLTHYLWTRKKMFEVVGPDRQFNKVGWNNASDAVMPKPPPTTGGAGANAPQGGGRGGRGGARGGGAPRGGSARGGARGGMSSGQRALKTAQGPQRGRFNNNAPKKTELLDLAHHLKKEKLLPGVFFVFSRKMTEQHAMSLRSLDFNNAREKSQVNMFIDQAISRLRQEDRELPQISMLREFLTLGIGVHHSGLLPIMKEVVEIMFARGFVKLLLATETFAMGLNLPTRTVVFTAIRKFDSKSMRSLTPGEYTQMAGRAGRRGLDKIGTVIIMNGDDGIIPANTLQTVILGQPTKLVSQFRLTYTMILSLLRIEAVKVEDVIQQSFSENATHVLRPEKEKQILELEKGITAFETKHGKAPEDLLAFDKLVSQYEAYTKTIYQTLFAIPWKLKYPLVVFRSKTKTGIIRRLGIVLSNAKDPATIMNIASPKNLFKKSDHSNMPYLPFLGTYGRNFSTVDWKFATKVTTSTVPVTDIEYVTNKTVKITGGISAQAAQLPKLIAAAQKAFENNQAPPEVDVSQVRAIDIQTAIQDRTKVYQELLSVPQHTFVTTDFPSKYAKTREVSQLQIQIGILRNQVTVSNTELLPDYEQRVNVLKAANYIDDGLNVLLKGRVACEISTGFELYLTELLFDNFLVDYEPEEIVALLSAFIFEGTRGGSPASVTPKLDKGKERVLDIVDHVNGLADAQQVALTQDEADFAEKDRFALMAPVYEWARGMSFYEITQLTDVQEGTIVRVISRLDEVCRAVMSAARIMGDVDLYEKVDTAREGIKRDIVFCSSLYL